MTPREAKISDHREMLEIRKRNIRESFNKRNDGYFGYSEKTRELLRWYIEQAKNHRDMIEQLEELPDYISSISSF